MGVATSFTQTLIRLQETRRSGPLTHENEICEGLALRIDPRFSVSGSWQSTTGRILELDMALSGSGEWVGLHLDLGQLDLMPQHYAALAIRGAAQENNIVTACLRAGQEDGTFTDSFFKRHMLLTNTPTDHLDALHLPSCPHFPLIAQRHELILFLPSQNCKLDLHDMRLFFL